MATQPIIWGGPVEADNQGISALSSQIGRSADINAGLASDVASKVSPIMQGIVHNQALKATAIVKDAQAKVLSFIDSNPYVNKAALQEKMSPDDYQSWHTKLEKEHPEYKDATTVPMYTAATDFFDSTMKQTREQAGGIVSLPGAQGAWRDSEAAESSAVRDRYVNRMAADQMIRDNRAQTLTSLDSLTESAQGKHDLELVAVGAEGSPWLSPAERRIRALQARVAGDSFQAEQAMLSGDAKGMRQAMDTLRSKNATDLYPNMNEQQRLALVQRLQRVIGTKGVQSSADGLVTPYVDERGKPDFVSIAKAITGYQGDDKDAVTKAGWALESEVRHVWDASTSAVQKQIHTAGNDPRTGVFSMARAQQNPQIAKLADQLNQDDPDKLTALSNIDVRRQAREDTRDRRAAADAVRNQIKTSHDNLEQIRTWLDDDTQSEYLHSLTPAQWDSQLHAFGDGLMDGDLEQARKDWKRFQDRGGKPDERPRAAVTSELKQAAQGDREVLATLTSKYEDGLKVVAHSYLRTHSTDDPGKLSDGMRAEIRKEMLRGAVVGAGSLNAIIPGGTNKAGVTRYDWERTAEFAGHDFRLPDGTVLKGVKGVGPGMVRLTNKLGASMWFKPESVEAARADKSLGWK